MVLCLKVLVHGYSISFSCMAKRVVNKVSEVALTNCLVFLVTGSGQSSYYGPVSSEASTQIIVPENLQGRSRSMVRRQTV